MNNKTQIEKNNELFANALSLKLIGKQNFLKLLYSGGFEQNYCNDYVKVLEKFLIDYEKKLKITLINLN